MLGHSATPKNPQFPNSVGHSAFVRYGIATGAVLLAWAARQALTPLWGPIELPFIFFYPAVVLSAWYGRRSPALLALILSILAADWFFTTPVHSFRLQHPSEVAAMISFLLVNVLLISAIEAMHRSNDRVANELSQRFQAEAQLAAEKELLATTLTSIGDGVIVTDAKGNIASLNAEAERLTGWTKPECSGKSLSEVFAILNEQTRKAVENPVEKVLRLGTVTGLANHTILIAKDGRETPIDDSAAPIRHGDGPILGVVLVFRDVTAQRLAQQESARLAAIVEFSGDAIFTKDLNGIINTWNRSAQRLFGYRAEEIIGKPVLTLVPRDRLQEEEEILTRLRQGQPSERLETIRVAKDGRYIPVSVSVSPLKNADGDVIGASKIIHDISDLVAARDALMREKQLLATTLASIGDGVILTDAEGRVTFLNTEAERLIGWTNSEANEKPLHEVFHIINEQTRTTVENPVDKVMRFDGVVGLANHTILISKDGREIPIDDSAAPIRQPGGPMFGIVLVFRDFTDRKRAEDALREREERFRTMADSAPVLIWLSGTDKLCTWFNRQWLEFTGRTMEQELGNGWAEGVHGDDFDRCLKTYVESFDARQPFTMEYRLRRHDGEWRWVLDHGVPRFEANDVFAGYIGSCIDVTEGKAQEQRLTDQARLLDLSNNAIILRDLDDRVIFWNRGAEEMYGFTGGEAMGRVTHELLRTEHPMTLDQILEQFHRDGRWDGELTHFRRDGSQIEVLSRWSLDLDAQGNPASTLETNIDITERKRAAQALSESESRFRAVVERSPFGIYVVDSQFRIAQMNHSGQDGAFRNVRPVIGRPFDEAMGILWPEDVAARIVGIFRQTLETGEPYYSRDFIEERADVEKTEGYEWELHRLRLADGQFGVLCYYYDSTKLREAEQHAQELRLQAEEANRLKDEFLAIMSHELRNPLNVILGYSELLVRNEEITQSYQLQRMAEAIKRNAIAQSKLIRDLLDLSRLRSGKLELNSEIISMMVSVNNAIDTVRSDAEAKQVTIKIGAPDELLFVEGDPVRLEQIIWNLLNNSVKFTPSGGKVAVRLGKEKDQVFLTVEDTGQGIESSFLPHVFELFRQADASTSRAHSGMGIGLAVVKQLVDLHRGSITAYSAGLGKGTTFTVKLPLSLEIRPELAPTVDLTTTLEKFAVLVVDDSEDTTEMLAQVLKMSGAIVSSAISGDEALRMIAAKEFDVVLSDISMPGMDGFEFLRRLRQLPRGFNVPVLALTGFGRPEDIDRAKSEGFFSHVTKPFDIDALMEILQRIPRKKAESS